MTNGKWRQRSFNVHVRQEVAAATHFVQFERVHHLSFRSFMNVFLGQINHLFGVHVTRHLESPDFVQVVLVLVADHIAASKTLHRDDHSELFVFVVMVLIVVLCDYF